MEKQVYSVYAENENRIKMIKALANSDVKNLNEYTKLLSYLNTTCVHKWQIKYIYESGFDANIFEEAIYIDAETLRSLEEALKEAVLKVENIEKLIAMKHRYVK